MPVIDVIKRILQSTSEDNSALLRLLSAQEEVKLEKYFIASKEAFTGEKTDIQIKLYALHSLFIIAKNHPSLEQKLNGDFKLENLAFEIYELAVIVNQYQTSWQHYFFVTAYAALADKATLLEKTAKDQLPKPKDLFEKILHFFIDLVLPISSIQDKNQRQDNLKSLEQDFLLWQDNLKTEDEVRSFVALSNLVSLAKKMQKYLLEGEGKNLSASIDNESMNALIVFSQIGNKNWELISNLLRFYFHKLYSLSIWNFANNIPFFKKFVLEQLKQESFLLSLFPSQRQALQDIFSTKKSTVLSMPTSSGKTLLAELKILFTRNIYPEDCLCAYVVPTNALVNQTVKRLEKSLPDLKIRQLLPYNHFDYIEEEILNQSEPDVLVSTPEKLNFLTKNDPLGLLKKLHLVIIDEAHNISDSNRGSIWEFLLANLKIDDSQIFYLLLTPFISNKEQMAQWLDENSFAAKSIDWVPTKQYLAYHSLHKDKGESKINYLPSARNSIIKDEVSVDLGLSPRHLKKELCEKGVDDFVRNAILIDKLKRLDSTVLILHKGPKHCESLAKKLANFLEDEFSVKNDESILYAQEIIQQELDEEHCLYNLLEKGIAFHHAKLPPLVKETIEELVAKDVIKVLIATTTLAQGMNFPIKTVIFETLGLGRGSSGRRLTYNDFWNIAGRAGRAYKDTEGHIILGWKRSNKKTKESLEYFIKRDIEEAISSLKAFFDTIEGTENIDYQFIKDKPIAQNFLHYLNHLMNVSYQYNLEQVKQQDIRNILANSLYFKQYEFSDGFLKSQDKIINFSQKYIDLIKGKKINQLKLADTLGVTDISLSTLIGRTQEIKSLKLSDCIDQNDKIKLKEICEVIHSVPELKIDLGREAGSFNPELVASILLDWINGKSVSQISERNELDINECSNYIFSKLKNYIPWGIAIYQKISNDDNRLLPSYAFYGVKDEQAVKLSYIGVPRFALVKIKKEIEDLSLYQSISKLKNFLMKNLTENNFKLEQNMSRNKIVNQIIKRSIA